MPKPTFFNLPEEKRHLILDLAIDEFSKYDYKNASISRIVTRAKIAKGSFYQYFEDKRDLLQYLIELAGKAKMEYLRNSHPPLPDMDFYAYLQWLFSAGVRFGIENPKMSQLGYRLLYSENPYRDSILKSLNEAALNYYRGLVTMGISQGDIDPSLDPELCTHIMNVVFSHLAQLMVDQVFLDQDRLSQGQLNLPDWEKAENTFGQIVRFLELGFRQSSPETRNKQAA
jgi:AcrR family transcriptional regulator